MKTDEMILELLKSQTNKYDFLKNNNLYLNIGRLINLSLTEKNDYMQCITKNKLFEIHKRAEIKKIQELFCQNNIKAIFFKGSILADLMYEKFYYRESGDIDLWIAPTQFNLALESLYSLGYSLYYENTLENEHHAVLKNNKFIVELHRKVLSPTAKIDETYLLSNIMDVNILNVNIATFSITATVLHLLYHLYMDYCLSYYNLCLAIINKQIPTIARFLYRAYEISLFIERYYDDINWKEIENDIRKQKLRIRFYNLILDILEIFPDIFPDDFIEMISNLNYIYAENDTLCKYMIKSESKIEKEKIEKALCNFIDDNWYLRKDRNIHEKNQKISHIYIQKKDDAGIQVLECKTTCEKSCNGLKFVFKVSDDDFYFSDNNSFDTQASDGVHLILCGTERGNYSYNSIFFFPKIVEEQSVAIAYDCLKNIELDDSVVKVDFEKFDRDYIITAIFKPEFLRKNYIDNYCYVGIVISDCSSSTKIRRQVLILSEEDSQWFNPAYYAKIEFN